MALTVGERSCAEDRLALRRDLDIAELGLGEAVRDLDVHADADAECERAARLAPQPLLLAQRLVVGRLEREVERPLVVAAVVGRARCRRQREGVGGEQVAPAHLGGIEPHLQREQVHRTFDRLCRLRAAGAAERPDRRRVGHDARELRLDLRDRVHAARHQRGEARQDRPDARIGAGVLQASQPIGLHPSVAGTPDRELEHRATAVGHGDHVLAPRLPPAHRARKSAGEPGDEDLLDAQQLGAEAAADIRRNHANVGRLETEDRRQVVAVLMGRLRREPQRQPPVVTHGGGTGPGLEWARRHALAHQSPRDDGLTRIEEMLVALRRVARADVGPRLGEEQDVAGKRLLGADDGGQRLVLHADQICGIDAYVTTLADDDRDDVTDEPDDVVREEGPPHPLVDPGDGRRLERAQIDVRRREDLCRGKLQSSRGVDLQNPCMRIVGADEHRMQRTR